MLIYAFRDARGVWHGDPDTAIHGSAPRRGVLSLPPTLPGQDPGAFDGQRIEVLYAGCDEEASEATYELDSGETLLATWHVHELLSPAYRDAPASPMAEHGTTTVRLEVGGPHHRYHLHAELVADGRVAINVVVSSPDGVVTGELAGEVDARDLGEISRHLASVARTASFSAPSASAPLASASSPSSSSSSSSASSSAASSTAPPAEARAKHRGQAWTPEAVALLQELHRAGKAPEQIAEELGRTENSIRWKLHGLGLAPRPGDLVPAARTPAEREEPKAYTVEEKRRLYPNAYKPWEPADELLLAERCAQGVSLHDLSQEFGRNEGAIASRLLKIEAQGPAFEEAWEYGG
ncbi:hypothetical protein [Streptomyces sp. NPDC015130]|uniref:hypothetical protein n=1 Tax=Streptomyces sp. NPDC015130 TaxID=3364940 RepID=UPI0036FA109D